MKRAHVIVFETDGKLAQGLTELSRQRGFRLNEIHHHDACLSCLRRQGSGVLVLKLGRDLTREMTLLERVSWLFPETATIVVGETANPSLVALAWDLGARFVLFPPQPLEVLPDVVEGFLPKE
jgi:hypothetical protein